MGPIALILIAAALALYFLWPRIFVAYRESQTRRQLIDMDCRSTQTERIREILRLILANRHTPQIGIDMTGDGIDVPSEWKAGAQLILDISPRAIRDFKCADNALEFKARFRDRTVNVKIPIKTIQNVFAKETGMGQRLKI